MLLAYALCGVWLYPALQGGLLSQNASAAAANMQSYSFPITVSLDFFQRISGSMEIFYYGLSVFIISKFTSSYGLL